MKQKKRNNFENYFQKEQKFNQTSLIKNVGERERSLHVIVIIQVICASANAIKLHKTRKEASSKMIKKKKVSRVIIALHKI